MVKKYTGIVIAKWDKNKVKNYTGTCILHWRRLKYEAPCIEFQVCASRTLVMGISVRLKNWNPPGLGHFSLHTIIIS